MSRHGLSALLRSCGMRKWNLFCPFVWAEPGLMCQRKWFIKYFGKKYFHSLIAAAFIWLSKPNAGKGKPLIVPIRKCESLGKVPGGLSVGKSSARD